MPWFDLMDELLELDCDSRWNHAKDVDFLQKSLFEQIGATIYSDEWAQQADRKE